MACPKSLQPSASFDAYVTTKNSRVDWGRRDEEILALVQTEVMRILTSDGKSERISISRIGKRIGYISLLEKHLDKMPKTKSYLESVKETVEDFQIRRIRWGCRRLNARVWTYNGGGS